MVTAGSLDAPSAGWWHTLADGRIECDLCPRACRLHEGQRGFCFVRENAGGVMRLSTYGRSTGFCIDPIEKKPLNHFLPGTAVLSFGTAGCNLGCRFCQNWNISRSREVEALSEEALPRTIAATARELGCRSVAFTYNDPVVWAEYAIDTARACREAGVKTVAVTAGYITAHARPQFFEFIDAANVDLKAFSEQFYHRLCFAHLDPVLATLRWLRHESAVWIEITTLLIPGENDSVDEVARLSEWIAENLGPDVPLHFTAFHPDFKLRDRPPTPPGTLERARDQARKSGLRFVYLGNVHDPTGESTFCPACNELLVGRDWHEITTWRMLDGACITCGTRIPGYFEHRPGTWGRRRQVVHLPRTFGT